MKMGTTKHIGLAILLAAMLLFCAACGERVPSKPDQNTQLQDQQAGQPAENQQEQQPGDQAADRQNAEEPTPPEPTAFTFSDVAGLEFYFASGAGGWRTVLQIHEGGSFDGAYSDSDMGSNGTEYPNGTVYLSEFSGAFTEPEPVDEYTWRLQIDHLEYAHEFGEEVAEGFRYIYTDAYGLTGAEELYIYLPGAPIEALPEAYRNWVGYHSMDTVEENELPFYGLYNVTEENGFSSYPIPSPADQICDRVAATELAAEEIETQLREAPTQLEMNRLSEELYLVWDDTLNAIWATLKEELDADAMEDLTAEQLEWIAAKEDAVQAAGAEVEGGSMYPTITFGEAAKWTKERVYELAEYLDSGR